VYNVVNKESSDWDVAGRAATINRLKSITKIIDY